MASRLLLVLAMLGVSSSTARAGEVELPPRIRRVLGPLLEASQTVFNVVGLRALQEAGAYATIQRIQRGFCEQDAARVRRGVESAYVMVAGSLLIDYPGSLDHDPLRSTRILGALQELRLSTHLAKVNLIAACTSVDGEYSRGHFILAAGPLEDIAARLRRQLGEMDRIQADVRASELKARAPAAAGAPGGSPRQDSAAREGR